MSVIQQFCNKRIEHFKILMNLYDIEIIYLKKVPLFRGNFGRSIYKRLTNTFQGDALLIPREDPPKVLVNEIDYIGVKEQSWIEAIEYENTEGLDEIIIEISKDYIRNEKSIMGLNTRGFNYNSLNYFNSNIKCKIFNIEKNILPEVLFGLYPEEIKYQREVSKIADKGIKTAIECLSPGRREYEIAAEADYCMLKNGAHSISVPTIISSGERSSYCHGWTGERELKNGDLVLIDVGPQKFGYEADETRTVLIGSDSKKERMLDVVNKSIEEVMKYIKPEIYCKDLDTIARKIIKKHGFPDIPGGIGHPISGFVVPRITSKSTHIEKIGMLHTIEPGIYLEKYGGVRIEDNIVVTKNGFELMTKSPRIF